MACNALSIVLSRYCAYLASPFDLWFGQHRSFRNFPI